DTCNHHLQHKPLCSGDTRPPSGNLGTKHDQGLLPKWQRRPVPPPQRARCLARFPPMSADRLSCTECRLLASYDPFFFLAGFTASSSNALQSTPRALASAWTVGHVGICWPASSFAI